MPPVPPVRLPAALRRRTLVRSGAGAAMALPFLGRGARAAVTWTLFTQQTNPAGAVVRVLQRIADQVRDRSRGALLINIRTAGFMPLDANQVLEGVGMGKTELGDDGGYGATIAQAGVMRLPLLATTPEEWERMAAEVRPILAAELEKRGLVLLAHYRTALQRFWSRLRATGFADIARQRVRVQSVEQAEFVRHYSGVHVFTSTVEAGEALAAGKLDGTFGTAAAAGRAWKALLKHVYLGGPNYNDAVIVANAEALRRLPPEAEPGLRAVMAEAPAWLAAAQDQEEGQVLRQLGTEGLKVTAVRMEELAEGIARIPTYWDSWARLHGPQSENLLATIRLTLDR